jgi:Tfp pilus assembly protein PilZ
MNDAFKLLVISRNEESRQLFESLINEIGVPLDSVESLRDALFATTRNAYNGVLIDLQTIVQADDKEKNYIHDLLEAYPVAKVRAMPSRRTIAVISAGKCKTQNSTIEEFINGECLQFKARSFRSKERKNINLPVILSSSAAFDAEETEKTFTVNVSSGGLFIFSARKWKVGESVWIQLKSSADNGVPIVGEVRWGIDWGRKFVIPGIGIRFTRISEEQDIEIFHAMR